MSKTKILSHHTVSGLNEKIASAEAEGYKVIGGHQAVNTHAQNRFAGMQHKDTIYEVEYSVTVTKEN